MWGVADVDAGAGFQAHLLEGEAQWSGMRFFLQSVTGADASGESAGQAEVAELAQDADTVAAGNEADLITASDPGKDDAGARDELWCVVSVSFGPEPVGEVPFRTRDAGCAIDAMPVRRVVDR